MQSNFRNKTSRKYSLVYFVESSGEKNPLLIEFASKFLEADHVEVPMLFWSRINLKFVQSEQLRQIGRCPQLVQCIPKLLARPFMEIDEN